MKRLFILICILSFFVLSCEQKLVNSEEETANATSDANLKVDTNGKLAYSDGEMVLGKKLKNPYTVENMQIALQNLREKSATFKELQVQANYLYVRILPQTRAEYDMINGDENIDLFEYPLDYEIIKQGNKYKDKSLGEDSFTWLYCAVPVDRVFEKSMKVEVLDNLFLPFGNGKEDSYSKSTDRLDAGKTTFLGNLEEEALRITDNLGESDNRKAKVAGWYASGQIRVFDELLSYNFSTNQYQQGSGIVPVPGCQVRANRWFTTETTLSETNGDFFIDHSWPGGKEVNYSIKWDRHNFDIRSGSYGQAYYNGPNQGYQWQVNINRISTPDNFIYAHAHRAAWYYYYNNTFGVISPPGANILGFNKMHLGAKEGTGRSHYFQFNGIWQASEVKLVFNLTDTNYNIDNGRSIFGTTIHELTHAAHWSIGMSYEAYCSNIGKAGRMAESWAQMVGWHVTRQVYGISVDDFGDFDNEQGTTLADINQTGNCFSNDPWYTPLFIDLIDDFNQAPTGADRPTDEATGYTITQLQLFLFDSPTNWYSYRTYLQNNSDNPTEAAATQLFSDYDN